ncbi:MAG: pyridoxal-phosphate dependent enzyme [Myxococcota bacterium]
MATSRLSKRWPGIAGLPRLSLVDGPTTIVHLDTISDRCGADVWCKRDDQSSACVGGNKVRKLEWLLADLRDRHVDAIITTGGTGSHFVLAAGRLAASYGIDTHALIVPQGPSKHADQVAMAHRRASIALHNVSLWEVPARAALLFRRLQHQGHRPAWIGPGGSSPIGNLGFVEAGLELAAQIEDGSVPEPEEIWIAFGSGGSAIGLAIGLAALGITSRVMAVRVASRTIAHRPYVQASVSRTVGLLRRADPTFPDVTHQATRLVSLVHDAVGSGYGYETSEGTEARQLAAHDSLAVDPTYTAKTLAALLRRSRSKRCLYWHTLPDLRTVF